MRSYVYWPNMNEDIGNIVNREKNIPSIKYILWPKTDRPRSRINVDVSDTLNGFCYLVCYVVRDSFSKWPEILRCRNPTTDVTMNYSQELFARFGVVDGLVSDNGTQFTSGDFKDFCVIFLINHIPIDPNLTDRPRTSLIRCKESCRKAGAHH